MGKKPGSVLEWDESETVNDFQLLDVRKRADNLRMSLCAVSP
jgi:hypothetical protein